jgi:hypothetical protein
MIKNIIMPFLRISDNRRFLTSQNGDPFFWLADTGWELIHRLSIEEIEYYFEIRKGQGFTVIQVVMIPEQDGLRDPNFYGQVPFKDENPLFPDESYFSFIDTIIELADKKGLVLALLPTWGDKIELMSHGIGPVIFNAQNAFSYGEWIGKRYRDKSNIIWINGGDRQGGGDNFKIWNALADGIKSTDHYHLMTYHPWGGGYGFSSSKWFHDAGWLDFNMAQSGHVCKGLPNYEIINADYERIPVKPCLDGEPRYEDHAVNWNPGENGWFDDFDVRQAAYWAVFSGAFGHTYGCHPVWQFYDGKQKPVSFVRRSWKEALELPGANQLQYLKNLLLSRDFFSRVPDQSLIADSTMFRNQLRATRGEDYALIYLPAGGEIIVNTVPLDAKLVDSWWFNPSTGAKEQIGIIASSSEMRFEAPVSGWGNDWVLGLDFKKE